MKKIRMALMALAAFTGIGGAYAVNHPKKPTGLTYFGRLTSAGHYDWFASAGTPCNPSSLNGAACTITSTYDVTGGTYADKLPPGATVKNNSGGKIHN